MASDHLRPVCYSAHIAPERFCEEELNDASRSRFHAVAFPILEGVILVTLVSSAQAQFREQRSLVDWRTFEVPDFGTSIQYPASIFAPAGNLKKVLDSGSSAQTDALSYPFTLVPTRPAKIPRPT
jgi:hypothetical protein